MAGPSVYVAEHAPNHRRGFYTSWIQTTATLGLLLSLVVILGVDHPGRNRLRRLGLAIPFILSIVLLAISVWIRLRMNESPAFKKMKEEGTHSKAPISEAFGQWKNAKIALLALFGLVAGQAVVWYTGQFYALFFLQNILRVDLFTANVLIAWSLILGTGGFIVFGMSDKIGRKPIIMAGCLIAAVSYFPVFKLITATANPLLHQAQQSTPVTVIADPNDCSFQFNPTGTSKFTNSCDIAKAFLARNSVNYSIENGAPGSAAVIRVGGAGVPSSPPTMRRSSAATRSNRRLPPSTSRSATRWRRPDTRPPQSGDREGVGLLRHLPRSALHAGAGADLPGDPGHHGLRPDRGGIGRAVPDPHPLHRHVAALPHRQRLVRRPDAGDGLRHDRARPAISITGSGIRSSSP